jgi:IclR family KDG regulon transcriptional repressor
MTAENEVRALSRGLQILEILADSRQAGGFSLSEIARRSGLAKSSTHRLLRTLVLNGYVRQGVANNENYFASFKLLTLANQVIQDTGLHTITRSHLEFLANTTGETVHLVLLDNHSLVYIDKVDSPSPIRMYSQIGNRPPLHCTGVGKAVLAFLPEQQRDALLEGDDLKRYTENTITDHDELRAHLQQIREQGYAIDDGEHEEYVRCIAVPLLARSGHVVGSVSISAVSYCVDLAVLQSWYPILSDRVRQLSIELLHYFDWYT